MRPLLSWEEDIPLLPALIVTEPEDGWRDTGVLDASGDSIFAYDGMEQIGFMRFDEP